MPKRRPLFQLNPSTRPGKDYNEGGISHQEPCGKAVFGPLNRPSLMSLARKDGNSVLRFHTVCGSQGALLHAILVDGMIETIEGRPELADAAVWKQRKAGHLSEYLFAARSEKEFERKRNAIPLLQRQCGTAH